MKDLVLVDPETGQQEHCGVIAKKRVVDKTTVWLTYDEPSRFWWIIWQEDELCKVGFVEARREVCWELFESIDKNTLADLRDQRSSLPDRRARKP